VAFFEYNLTPQESLISQKKLTHSSISGAKNNLNAAFFANLISFRDYLSFHPIFDKSQKFYTGKQKSGMFTVFVNFYNLRSSRKWVFRGR